MNPFQTPPSFLPPPPLPPPPQMGQKSAPFLPPPPPPPPHIPQGFGGQHQQQHQHHQQHQHQQQMPPQMPFGMPPLPFDMPPLVPMSLGPVHHEIFSGHLGDGFPCTGKVFEVSLARTPCFLEGVHIVPKGVRPQTKWNFEGQTLPDMNTRNINMEIYARDVDTETIKKVCVLTFAGGVQWFPFESPYNKIAVDYLAFKGDFEKLSILVHGGVVDSKFLSKEALELTEKGLPVPPGFNDIEGFDYDSDEDGLPFGSVAIAATAAADGTGIPAGDGKGDRMARLPKPTPVVIGSLNRPVNFIQERLLECDLAPCEAALALFQEPLRGFSSRCNVSNFTAAKLVECVFSLEADGFVSLSLEAQKKVVENLTDRIINVWTSIIERPPSNLAYDILANTFDEDAAGYLATFVIKSLYCLCLDVPLVVPEANMASLLLLCKDVLELCQALAINEITACAFSNAGGIALLAQIARQQPPLPPSLQHCLLETLSSFLMHFQVAKEFVKAPEVHLNESGNAYATTETSGYQSLLLAGWELKTPSRSAALYKRTLNWCFFVDACISLHDFATHSLDDIAKVSQTVSWQLSLQSSSSSSSSNNLGFVEDSLSSSSSNDAADKAALFEACEIINRLVLSCGSLVTEFQGALSACVDQIDRVHIALVLIRSHVTASLVSLTALAETAGELAAVVEWSAPYAQQLETNAKECRCLLTSIAARIFNVGDMEIVFAMRPKETRLLWRYLSQDEHLLGAQTVDELKDLSSSACHEALQNYTLGSLGWSFLLAAHAVKVVESFVLCSINLQLQISRPVGDRETFDDSPLSSALSDIVELCSFPSGKAIAVRVVSRFAVHDMLEALDVALKAPNASSLQAPKIFAIFKACLKSDFASVVQHVRAELAILLRHATESIKSEDAETMSLGVEILLLCGPSSTLASKEAIQLNFPNIIETITYIAPPTASASSSSSRSSSSSSSSRGCGEKPLTITSLSEVNFALRFVACGFNQLFLENFVTRGEAAQTVDLIEGAIAILETSTAWARGGAGWALEPSFSVSGYQDVKFPFHQPLTPGRRAAPESSQGSSEEEDGAMAVEALMHEEVDVADATNLYVHDASLLLDSIHASLVLLLQILRILASTTGGGTGSAFECEKLLVATMEANSFACSLVGCNKAGEHGLSARRIANVSREIFAMYCPPSPWAANTNLIPFLVAQAFLRPALFQGNLSLIADLIPTSKIGYDAQSKALAKQQQQQQLRRQSQHTDLFREDEAEVESSSSCSSSRLTCEFESILFEAENENEGEADGDGGAGGASDEEVRLCNAWQEFLCREPILVLGDTKVALFDSASKIAAAAAAAAESQKGKVGEGEESASSDPNEPLRRALASNSFTISTILLGAATTASQEIMHEARRLCHLCIAIGGAVALKVAKPLMLVLQNQSFYCVHIGQSAAGDEGFSSSSSGTNAPRSISVEEHENVSKLCRLLLFSEDLCNWDAPCLVLSSEGLVYAAFTCLHSTSQEVVTMALQVLTSSYRTLSRVASRLASSSSSLPQAQVLLLASTRKLLELIADGMCGASGFLSSLITRFQNAEGSLVLAQAALFVGLLPLRFTKSFIDAINNTSRGGITIEVLTIKIWIFFEEAFQNMIEATEVIKNKSASALDAALQEFIGEDGGEDMVRAAHAQVAASSSALRAVSEMTLQAYLRGWIPLGTLARAMRTTLADPKKVALRYQRSYTMWSTERMLTFGSTPLEEKESEEIGGGGGGRGGGGAGGGGGADGDGGNSSSGHCFPPVYLFGPNCTGENAIIDYEARHAIIASSLRKLVEDMTAITNITKVKQALERIAPVEAILSPLVLTSSQMTDLLLCPFSNEELSVAWYAFNHLQHRVGGVGNALGLGLFAAQRLDALHAALRRTMVRGDESRCSMYDYSQQFQRLVALPKLVDPSANKRRKERRETRKREAEAAVFEAAKKAAEAAEQARLAEEAEKQRIYEESQRMKVDMAAAAIAASLPAMQGVPKMRIQAIAAQGGLGKGPQLPPPPPPRPPRR